MPLAPWQAGQREHSPEGLPGQLFSLLWAAEQHLLQCPPAPQKDGKHRRYQLDEARGALQRWLLAWEQRPAPFVAQYRLRLAQASDWLPA